MPVGFVAERIQSMLKRIEDIPVTIRRMTVPARTLDAIS